MLKALTFIGSSPNKYSPTTYYIERDGKRESCKTHLFPEVVVKLYQPTELIAFATDEVLKDIHEHGYLKHLDCICSKYGVDFQKQRIESGTSTNELWEIFNVYADSVGEGDEIILDITHGFRSLPVLALPAIAYLRQVKNVEFKHILYGAFEARDPSKNETPIFNLTPFVSLLDWTNAVNVFQLTGDARPIAELDIHNDISDALTKLSESLLTNRTIEVQEAAFEFNTLFSENSIEELVTEQEVGSQAPFRMLINQLKENYGGMAAPEPRNNPEYSIKKQYEQIKWYIDNQHYFQAVTLIREWLISWQYVQWRRRHKRGWLQWHRHREPIQDAFNDYVSAAPDPDDAAWELWEECAKLRNDLAHCGMRTSPPPMLAREAIAAIEALFKRLTEFARDKGVVPKENT